MFIMTGLLCFRGLAVMRHCICFMHSACFASVVALQYSERSMNGHRTTGAGADSTFLDADIDMGDLTLDQSAYFDSQHYQNMQCQPSSFGHSPVGECSTTNEVRW